MNLNNSRVLFDENTHTYWKQSTQLFGITGMLARQLFADKYKNVPERILARAAEKGGKIHADCETYDFFGECISEYPEVKAYANLKEQEAITSFENEYLVSDEEYFATKIDMVGWHGEPSDDEVDLFDFKTTYKLDTEYLSWQLSINAYLFELQNPGVKVRNLYGIWLRGETGELVSIQKIDFIHVKELLETEKNGGIYTNPFAKDKSEIVPYESEVSLIALEEAIVTLKKELDEYETMKENLLSALEAQMDAGGVKKWETDQIIITRVLPTTTKTFDSKKFKADHPELAKEYEKDSVKKGFVKITLK